MIECDCYCTEEKIIGWHTPVDPKIKIVHKCNGTRERDECSCGGDRAKCNFYLEVRAKALPKFGEWISVKDRLPKKNKNVLIYRGNHIGDMMYVYTYKGNSEWEDEYGYWSRTDEEGITHWMHLPEPPREKEN